MLFGGGSVACEVDPDRAPMASHEELNPSGHSSLSNAAHGRGNRIRRPLQLGFIAGAGAFALGVALIFSHGWLQWAMLAGGVFGIAFGVWKLLADAATAQQLERGNPELAVKLTSQLPVMVYQFRTYPTGHSSVTYTNDAIRTIYEADPDVVKKDGSRLLDLVHPGDLKSMQESLKHSYFTLEPWAGEFRVVLPKGGLQWRFAQARIERLPDGGTLWHGFVADITEKKRAEESHKHVERMRIAKEKAEDSDRAKNAFLAMMSHEIRTPMHAVTGYLDILRTSGCTPTQLEYVESAQVGARNMISLLDDLLAVSRMESGDMEVSPHDFELKEWLRGLAAIFRKQVEGKGLTWTFQMGDDLPEVLFSDRVRLTQCLFGLLDNAVKFTAAGSIHLKVARQAGVQSQRVRFDIEDSGAGISEDQLPRIFEPFSRGDESSHRKFGGVGLGLSICHNLTRLLGGTLSASSTLGEGSTFSLEIPVRNFHAQTHPAADAEDLPAEKDQGPLNLHILIVEDQKTNQRLMGLLLKKLGCTYDLAENGLIAISKFSQGRYDAILMDIQMPELDGIAATKRIRLMEQIPHNEFPVPIIAVTANAFDTDREECLAIGMNGFLAKPVRSQQLSDSLRRSKHRAFRN